MENLTGIRAWASRGGGATPDPLASLQEILPVGLIATPRRLLQTCSSHETIQAVAERNWGPFDYFPVAEVRPGGADTIVGLLHIAPLMSGVHDGSLVNDHAERLSEGNLLGADASLLDFVRNADSQGCRLTVSARNICGIVCLSDLQQLPVRASLFAMVTHLEIVMVEAIRREFEGSCREDWRGRLSGTRLEKVNEKAVGARLGDSFVDTLLLTEFCDKRDILARSARLRVHKGEFSADLRAIQLLRDKLAHASDYADTRERAMGTCQLVRSIDRWISFLAMPDADAATGEGERIPPKDE